MVSAYTKYDIQLIKVAPEDVPIQSETCRAFSEIKSNHKNSVHLVGLYTYCKVMHGAYNIKPKYFMWFVERAFLLRWALEIYLSCILPAIFHTSVFRSYKLKPNKIQ